MTLRARTPDGDYIFSMDFGSGFEIRDKYPVLLSPFPDVDVEVFPRDCQGKILHFVHKSKNFTSGFHSHPESLAHIIAKLQVGKYYEELLRNRGDTGRRVEYECPIESRKRICDVCIKDSTGKIERVGEIQLAAITTDELERRTRDYEEMGIHVSWFIGGKASTPANRLWLYDRLGDFWEID